MWPFSKTKREAELAIEWMPRAVEVAGTQWVQFKTLPTIKDSQFEMQVFAFVTSLEKGLREWKAFKKAPESLFLLIAALGIEYSGTHSRSDLEQRLGLSLPINPLIDESGSSFRDSQAASAMTKDLVESAKSKWIYYNETVKFKSDVPLSFILKGFSKLFLEYVRSRLGMNDVPEDFVHRIVALGVAESGSHSLDETMQALEIEE